MSNEKEVVIDVKNLSVGFVVRGFDDCFTELDPKSENEIVSNIRGMLKGRTVIFLSHQFRISPGSDRVSMMENGRIIDSGTHDDLIERCDIYRRMYLTGGGIVE